MRTTCWAYCSGARGADSAEVAAEFREAVRLRPDFAEAHNNLGLVLTQTDDDEPAIAAFREAIRIRPDYADAHANLGAALHRLTVNKPFANWKRRSRWSRPP